MPADTCKANKHDAAAAAAAGRPKGKSHHSEEGSEKSPNSGSSVHKSNKRLKFVNEQSGKTEPNASSQRKETLGAHRYRDIFRAHTTKVNASDVKLQAPSKDLVSGTEGLVSETMDGGNVRQSTVPIQQKEKVAERMLVKRGLGKQTEKKKSKCINEIERSVKQLLDRQSNEAEELQKQWRARKAKLEKHYELESMVIHSITINSGEAIRINKLKILEASHRQKLDELDLEMYTELKGMEARHQTEIEEEEKEGIRKMNEWIEKGLFGELQSKEGFGEEEVLSIKSASLEEENVDVHRSAELHNDTVEKSGSAADPIMCGNGAISMSSNAIQVNNEATKLGNVGKRTEDSLGVQGINHAESAVAAEEVVQIATSKNDQLSTENPTLQTEADANKASERDPAARMEQDEEAGRFTHIESMNSPCTMNPPVVQAYTNQHQVNSLPVSEENAISSARLLQLNNEDVRAETSGIHNEMIQDIMPSSVHSDGMPCNASGQALHRLAVPLDTGVSCSTCAVPENQPMAESSLPPEAPIQFQEDERPLNRWVEATPRRPSFDGSLYDPRLHSQSQFDTYMASRSVLPSIISQESDPLEREFERIGEESNQVSKNHADMVGRIKSECDKEIEKIVGEIHSKYKSRFQEAEASFIEKKKEVDRYQWKVVMNIKLAEAFRRKCIDHRTAPHQVAFTGLTQQQQQQLFLEPHQFRRRTVATRPMSSVLPL